MIGICGGIVAAVFSSAKDLLSKKLSADLPGVLSGFASFLFAIPFYVVLLAVLWVSGIETFAIGPGFFTFVVVRALSDTAAEWCKMSSFRTADISVASPIMALSPVMMLLLSPLITGDQWNAWGGLGVVVATAGSVGMVWSGRRARMVKELDGVVASGKGMMLAFLSAFFFAVNGCFDRLAVQVASPSLSGCAMTVGACLLFLPFLRRQEAAWTMLAAHRRPLWIRGGLEVGFMVSKLVAMQYLQAPYVSALVRVAIVVNIALGALYFQERDLRYRLMFGILITVGVLLILIAG